MRDVGSHKIEIKASKCSTGLCQKTRIASCCARDEGGAFEAARRGGFKTAISCYGPILSAVVNVMVKRRDSDHVIVWMRETSANEPLMTHRKHLDAHRNQGAPPPWEEHSGYLHTGYAVSGVKARGSHAGSRMEL